MKRGGNSSSRVSDLNGKVAKTEFVSEFASRFDSKIPSNSTPTAHVDNTHGAKNQTHHE